MKKYISCLVAAAVAGGVAAEPSSRLWFDRPAEFFEETIVIGNGRLGAIIYGGAKSDTIPLNDITLWTGEPDRTVTNPNCRYHADCPVLHGMHQLAVAVKGDGRGAGIDRAGGVDHHHAQAGEVDADTGGSGIPPPRGREPP